jgi:hypothetical protein
VNMILMGEPEGKRPLRRHWRRWEGRIRMNLGKISWEVCSGFSWLRIGAGGCML